MNWRAIWTIVRKDLKVVLQSKAILIPMILVPLILTVVLPLIGGVVLASTDPDSPELAETKEELSTFFDNLPETLQTELDRYETELQQTAYLFFAVLFAPMFLIVPLMIANVIAADSFVGEKERKTLEALAYTPTTDTELYMAKLLAPWLAANVVAWVSFVFYTVILNAVLSGVMEGVFLPTWTWVVMMLWLVPAAAALGLGAMVFVSSRVSTFQEAYQIGGAVVLPVILLLFGQMGGVFYFGVGTVKIIGLLVWIASLALIGYGAKTFRRGEMIVRL